MSIKAVAVLTGEIVKGVVNFEQEVYNFIKFLFISLILNINFTFLFKRDLIHLLEYTVRLLD